MGGMRINDDKRRQTQTRLSTAITRMVTGFASVYVDNIYGCC